jgi:hypothetical protein
LDGFADQIGAIISGDDDADRVHTFTACDRSILHPGWRASMCR